MKSVSIKELAQKNICTGCGICVSESDNSVRMEWDELGFISPVVIDESFKGDVLRVCPFNPNPENVVEDEDKLADIFLNDAPQFDDKVGRFENTYIGYSEEYRATSSSGGLATYIFEQLLIKKVVDHLYIVKEVGGTYEYQLFSSVADIVKISKTRYIPVTLEKLFLEINGIEGKIAVSGVACFIKAIRLKQYYNPELKEKIPFLIGIICGGWKSKFFTDFLAQSSGIINAYHDQEYRIKDVNSTASDYSFGAFDKRDNFHQMKMAEVGDMWGTGLFKAKACDFCTDVLTELADISLGDAWLPEYRNDGLGTSVIITRTKLADELINVGIKKNELAVKYIKKEKIIQSQSSSFSHRRDALKYRIEAAKDLGIPVPHIRARVLKDISLPYKIVQKQRERTRLKSLVYWWDTKDVLRFNIKMRKELFALKVFTKIYHKLR